MAAAAGRTPVALPADRQLTAAILERYGADLKRLRQALARRAHAAYFLILAEEGGTRLIGAERQGWMDRFDLEQENFRAALDWLIHTGNAEWGQRLGTALHLYWRDHASAAGGRNR